MGGKVATNVTVERLRRLMAAVPSAGTGERRTPPRSRFPVLVRCLSATPDGGGGVGDQIFNAEVVNVHAGDSTQDTEASVWLTVLNEVGTVVTPVADRVYLGLFSGYYDPGDDPRLRVFSTGASSGGTEADELTITYVSNVCPVIDSETGFVTDISIEKRSLTVLVPVGETLGEPVCDENPEACCEPDVANDCCEEDLPAVLYATFSEGTGSAACLDGVTVPLTFAGAGVWAFPTVCQTLTACSGDLAQAVILTCTAGEWSISLQDSDPCAGDDGFVDDPGTSGQDVFDCDPLLIVFEDHGVDRMATPGTTTVTISETPP